MKNTNKKIFINFHKFPPEFSSGILRTLSFAKNLVKLGWKVNVLTSIRQIESLWLFLDIEEVEPTNNLAERILRYGILWRKRSKGTQSEKGTRWVERILSFKQTCSIRSLDSFPLLVELLDSYFKEQEPDLSWI